MKKDFDLFPWCGRMWLKGADSVIPKRYRDKAMRIYCDYFAKQRKSGEFITEAFSVQKLYDYGFPRKADAEETTHVLAAMGDLSVHNYYSAGDFVEGLTDEGKYYFEVSSDQRRMRWFDRLCGFVSGVCVTVLSGLIVHWLTV